MVVTPGSVGPLRQVLVRIRRARDGVRLDRITAEIGVTPDEVASMVDYWVRRGLLTREEVSSGCPPSGCGGCAAATNCAGSRLGGAPRGPVLHTIRPLSPPSDASSTPPQRPRPARP